MIQIHQLQAHSQLMKYTNTHSQLTCKCYTHEKHSLEHFALIISLTL